MTSICPDCNQDVPYEHYCGLGPTATVSHKDAPELTTEQQVFEDAYKLIQEVGVIVALGRDKHGNYLAVASKQAWKLWQAARNNLVAQSSVVVEAMRRMTDFERSEFLIDIHHEFCKHCGAQDPKCVCMRDE